MVKIVCCRVAEGERVEEWKGWAWRGGGDEEPREAEVVLKCNV
jgi:hypothetical protein